MKAHDYQVITIDATPAGLDFGHFWHCSICGTSFGGVRPQDGEVPSHFTFGGFLAGTGLNDLGNDCDKAKEAIDRYAEKYPEYLPIVQRERNLPTKPIPEKPRHVETSSTEPSITLTLRQAFALRDALHDLEYDSGDFNSAIQLIEKAEDDLRFADY